MGSATTEREGKVFMCLRQGLLAVIGLLLLLSEAQGAPADKLFFQKGYTQQSGSFTITGNTRIVFESADAETRKMIARLEEPGGWLNNLRRATSLDISIVVGGNVTQNDIVFSTTKDADFASALRATTLTVYSSRNNDRDVDLSRYRTKVITDNVKKEGYKYKAGAAGVTIQYNEALGAFRGMQEIVRLVMRDSNGIGKHRELPLGMGIDYPRYAERYISLDVARVFMPVEQVIGLMGKMSLHKINRLLLYLSDDVRKHGNAHTRGYFRLETAHPTITAPDGNYYTKKDWDKLEAAAARYGIEIIPEISSPQQSQALRQYRDAIGDDDDDIAFAPREIYHGNRGNIDVSSNLKRTRAAAWVANFIKKYKRDGWFKSDTINIGGIRNEGFGDNQYTQDGVTYNRWADMSAYIQLLYTAMTSDDTFKRVQMTGNSLKGLTGISRNIEVMYNYYGGDFTNYNYIDGRRWHDFHNVLLGFFPVGRISSKGLDISESYRVKQNERHRRYQGTTTGLPDGIGMYNAAAGLAFRYPDKISRQFQNIGIKVSIPAIGLQAWNGHIYNPAGSIIADYADTGYNSLKAVSQEFHGYEIENLYPSRYPYFASESESYSMLVDASSRHLRIQLRDISNHRLLPGVYSDNWFGWDDDEISAIPKGPLFFLRGVTVAVEMVGEGKAMTGGRICTDSVYKSGKRSVSLCDADSWTNDIAGSGILRKTGPGRLALLGSNSFTGNIELGEGTLMIEADENLGAVSSTLMIDEGMLAFVPGTGGTITISSGRRFSVETNGGMMDLNGNYVNMEGGFVGSGMLGIEDGIMQLENAVDFDGSLIANRRSVVEIHNEKGLGVTLRFNGGILSFGKELTIARPQIMAAAGRDVRIDTNGQEAEVRATISGRGGLVKLGQGTLHLTSDANSYRGDTFVQAGVLVGDASSISGDMFASSGITVTFDQQADGEFGGEISLAGGLFRKTGAGALTLQRPASATSWEVMEGTLASEGAFAGNVAIAAGSGFSFLGAAGRYEGTISGSGDLVRDGSGILVLGGESRDFAGDIRVAANSTLLLEGFLSGKVVHVEANGMFGGDGSAVIGRITVSSGGVFFADGIQVNGRMQLAPGAKYEARLTRTSRVGGAKISGGILALKGNFEGIVGDPFRADGIYEILFSSGGVEGKFADVTTEKDFPFMKFAVIYSGREVRVQTEGNSNVITDILKLDDQEETEVSKANTEAMARMLDDARSNTNIEELGILEDAIMVLPLDSEVIKDGLDSLSGELHASVKSAFITANDGLRDAVASQSRAAIGAGAGTVASAKLAQEDARFNLEKKQWGFFADDDNPVFWAKPLVAWGSNPGGDEFKDIKYEGGGFLLGGDANIYKDWRVGFFGGISSTDFFQSQQKETSGKDNARHAGAYGGKRWGRLSLLSGFSYTWHRIKTERTATVGNMDIPLQSNYNARTFGAFAEASYQIETANSVVEPFIAATYTKHGTVPFGEITKIQDVEENIFNMSEQNSTELAMEIGARALTSAENLKLPSSAKLYGGLSLKVPTKKAQIVIPQSAGNSQPVDIRGTPVSGKSVKVEIGVNFRLDENSDLNLVYSYSQLIEKKGNARSSFEGRFAYSF